MFISRGILRFSRKTAFLPSARLCPCPYKKPKKRTEICPLRAAARSCFLLYIFERQEVCGDFIQKILNISLFNLVCVICEYFLNFLMKNA